MRSTSAEFIHSHNKTKWIVRTGVFVNRITLEKNNTLNNEGQKYKVIGVETHGETNEESIIVKIRKKIILTVGYVKNIPVFNHM